MNIIFINHSIFGVGDVKISVYADVRRIPTHDIILKSTNNRKTKITECLIPKN